MFYVPHRCFKKKDSVRLKFKLTYCNEPCIQQYLKYTNLSVNLQHYSKNVSETNHIHNVIKRFTVKLFIYNGKSITIHCYILKPSPNTGKEIGQLLAVVIKQPLQNLMVNLRYRFPILEPPTPLTCVSSAPNNFIHCYALHVVIKIIFYVH